MDKIKYPTKLMMIKFLERKKNTKLNAIAKEYSNKMREAQDEFVNRLPKEAVEKIKEVDDYVNSANKIIEGHILEVINKIKDDENYMLEKQNSYGNAFSRYFYNVSCGGSSGDESMTKAIGDALSDKILRADKIKLTEAKNIEETKVKQEFSKLIANLNTFPRNKQRYDYLVSLGFDLSELAIMDKIEESIGLNKIDIKAIQ